MTEKKFNPKKLEKLNNPERLLDESPDYIWEKLGLENPKVLIDIGAGTGFFSRQFLDRITDKKEGKVYACDISIVMINWMKDNILEDYPNIFPVKMEESIVPLENNLANLVYMMNLHHELEKPDKILKESLRLLKKGGKIFITDWKKEDMPQGPPTEIRCLPEDVSKELQHAGFKNIQVHNGMPKHFFVVAEK